MSRHYKKTIDGDVIKFPSVTTIISDCTDSSAPLTQWAANMCKLWIEDNCEWDTWEDDISEGYYTIRDTDLDEMRFNFRKVSKKALDIGSEVHNAIEMHLQGKAFKLTTKEATNAYDAFLDWKKEVDLKPISLELTVWGNRWAGTLDYYGYYKEKLYVIDWKTSANHYPEMRYQVAAYRWAMEEKTTSDVIKKYGKRIENNLVTMDVQAIQKHRKPIQGCGILRLDKETGMPHFKDTSKTYDQDLRVFNRMVDLYFERHPRISKQFDNIIPF